MRWCLLRARYCFCARHNFLLCYIRSDMCVDLAVGLLDTEHITNVDQEEVTETYVFDSLYMFSREFRPEKRGPAPTPPRLKLRF
jgi:hypothetical protein